MAVRALATFYSGNVSYKAVSYIQATKVASAQGFRLEVPKL
jgi:hypothetical protein